MVNGTDEEEYEVTVDPELLRFLARFPREQQMHLLRLLEGLDQQKQQVEETPRPAAPSAIEREGRSRAGVPTGG